MAISSARSGVEGIQLSFEEAHNRFAMIASADAAGTFSVPETAEGESGQRAISDVVIMVVNAVRKNSMEDLKENFVSFIY